MSDDESSAKRRKLNQKEVSLKSNEPKKVGYNRCRKPIAKSSNAKCSTASLRKASEYQVKQFNLKYSINPPLTTDDRLCYACRIAITEICESSQSSSQGTPATTSEGFSQNVLENLEDMIQDEIEIAEVPVNELLKFKSLMKNMQSKFYDLNTKKDEKLQLLTLLPLDWTAADIEKYIKVSDYMIRLSKKLQTENGPMSKPCVKKGHLLSDEVINRVINFYTSEDNTYILPGKKDCVTLKDEAGNKITEQKRLLLCILKELYVLFTKDHPDSKIGFSTFANFRPKCCLLAGSSGTHAVCVCSIHQNVKFLLSGCSLPKLTKGYSTSFENYKDVLTFIVCEKNINTPTSDCYLDKCKSCPGIEKLKNYLITVFEENEIEEVCYSQWVSSPITTLKNIVEATSEFIECFCEKIEKLLPHAFISTQQSSYFKTLKATLPADEAIVNLDYAKNYAFVVQNAPPGFHWNNNQATVFVSFIYYKENNEIKGESFVVISDNLNHDTVAVYTYQLLLMDYLKKKLSVQKIHYFSDGAPQQFKNFKNNINICYHNQEFGIKADWHFFLTAHGKGACDGVGGSVKRSAAKASLRLSPDDQILTATELYNWLKNRGNYKTVEFAYSAAADYERNVRKLKKRFENPHRVKNLQKQHCVIPLEDGTVMCKSYSSSSDSTQTKIID